MLEWLGRSSRALPPWRTKARAGRVIGYAWSVLTNSPLRRIQIDEGCIVEIDLRSRTEAQVFWNGTFEPFVLRLLKALHGRFGGVVYDIGANIGLLAIPLAWSIRPYGRVLAFEPIPANAVRLRKNAELNELDLSVYEVALGAARQSGTFVREARFGTSTGNAVMIPGAADPPWQGEGVTAEVWALDELVKEQSLPPPSIVKIDVEGMETDVLRGAKTTIAETRPLIVGEFNSTLMPYHGTTFLDAYRELPDGYEVFAFLDDFTVTRREPAVGIGDVLLAPKERVALLPIRVAEGR